ncbi:hypothetical protein HN592_05995 [Candidatus Woesearchaeota archaeon]|jgi:hypothetical protein|nr:hypothetical protein [Candidatus Woesearchaeota archaeon]MBT3304805.1 hypothetical protein [Candidatus Woesearchaeota archaeon]MBT4367859.1 hypothetical protein [Candidatus Woesearchaeota archaeon]MBT4712347.1 hypothetical protein [Candidatus Woesearchaeota archaeon]MBT6639259.1 hypothetical protein [Candidatus Woesearchaeota archaeon]
MKITIDTKEDSHHEIKKVIHLLNVLVGSEPLSNSTIESSSSNVEYPNVADVFSSPAEKNVSADLPNVGAFMDAVDEKKDDEKPEESSEIVMY